MLTDNIQIAIVGGGPGGLTLATLLQQKGATVKVYERDSSRNVRVQGATLDLHEESGLEALRRAGLTEAFYSRYRPDAGKLRIVDKNGLIRFDEYDQLPASNLTKEETAAYNRPEIDRGPLRDILLDSLETDTVIWDSQFVKMKPKDKGWELFFKNGSTARAQLVIGCDGANSKIRPYLTSVTPVYSGVTVVEGNVYNSSVNAPLLTELVNGGKVFAFGDEQSLILSAKGDGSLSFYTGCKVNEDWVEKVGINFNDKQQVLRWFQQAYSGWSAGWQELFSSDEVWCIPRPQYHYPLDQHWEGLPDLTIIGDAAHRMPPYAGEGVNQAMQDAFTLAEELTAGHHETIQSALSVFATKMLARASMITEVSLASTELLHSTGAIEGMLNIMKFS